MNNFLGINGIQVDCFYTTEKLNMFLKEHDGKILDIQNRDKDIVVIYVDRE